MSTLPLTRCIFNATSVGTVDFVVSSAVTGYLTPALAGAADASVYNYAAQTVDVNNVVTGWEVGTGAYTVGSLTLARTTVIFSSNAGAKVNFATAPQVMITILPTDLIAAGTLMLFQQTAAPTGWTKQSTHNDKALRVVSGAASSGGSSPFSTVFGLTATSGFTLLTTHLASHTHPDKSANASPPTLNFTLNSGADMQFNTTGGATGGDTAHTHPIELRVNYVDIIIAAKD